MAKYFLIYGLVYTLAIGHVYAEPTDLYIFNNTAAEQRFNHLINELRCMVCNNQSLAESNSELAISMKLLISNKIKNNESDDAIKEYLTERYGQNILLQPRLNYNSILLWLIPVLLLLAFSSTLINLCTISNKK